MELFRNPNINWIGKKWPLLGLSVVLSVTGLVSLFAKGGPRYGIDFKGGTQVHLQFQELPSLERIRSALRSQGLGNSTLQQYGPEADHEVLIRGWIWRPPAKRTWTQAEALSSTH